jgi:hypothetical protein
VIDVEKLAEVIAPRHRSILAAQLCPICLENTFGPIDVPKKNFGGRLCNEGKPPDIVQGIVNAE